MNIELPISKSIANRWLMLQAIHGDELMPVSDSMPDDVQILHRALSLIQANLFPRRLQGVDCKRNVVENKVVYVVDLKLHLGNCGTAMRFLTAYAAQLENRVTILDGVERMRHRPIGQLVDALREIGAQIEYLGEEGFPPLRIKGCILDKHRIVTINHPLSTQYISALLLIGANVITNSTSPYINLTHSLIENYLQRSDLQGIDARSTAQRSTASVANEQERDWSSAAFWYEYVALYGGEITLPGLYRDSLQGDKVVADIFAHLGVHTEYTAEGITLSPFASSPFASRLSPLASNILEQDFGSCPDLYPAVALTCERLGIELHATGIESLPLKESDRLRAVREHRTDADHRMAMALLVAGYEVDDTACISKSYPHFLEHFHRLPSNLSPLTSNLSPIANSL